MDDVAARIADLEHSAADVRLRALETTRTWVEELTGIWNDLNAYVPERLELREVCDGVAADIALFEKLGYALDAEWLAESKREHAASAAEQAPHDNRP